jgi:23S rRNA pseudouridine1911/1915/1917 synthase
MKWSDNDARPPEIEYSDNHLLVAVKPAGFLTQPDASGRENLEEFAKAWVKKEFHKPGAVFLHCIHRLDRPVAGLVLFARTSKALSRLNEASRAGEIRRWYLAEVEGILPAKEGILEHFLNHGDHRADVVKETHPEAKKAVLHYQVQKITEHTTVVRIELHTGRYHQIRAQFSHIGHPVVGDTRYGSFKGSGDEIHLACTDLELQHPVTKEPLKFHTEAAFG